MDSTVKNMDIFAFTLQYEMSFTNVLNMLDLSGIPLAAAERTEADGDITNLLDYCQRRMREEERS